MRVFAWLSGLEIPPKEGMHRQTLSVLAGLRSRGFTVRIQAECRSLAPGGRSSVIFDGLDIDLVGVSASYPIRLFARHLRWYWLSRFLRIPCDLPDFADFDVVFVEGVALLPLLPDVKQAGYPVLFSSIDAWSLRQSRLSLLAPFGFKRFALFAYASFMRMVESRYFSDGFVHVYSDLDADYLRRLYSLGENVVAIPTLRAESGVVQCVDSLWFRVDRCPRVVIWGDLSLPQISSDFQRFLYSVIEPVAAENPGFECVVIGRVSASYVSENFYIGDCVRYFSWAEDISGLLGSSDVLICLDRSGTGLKNRVIEGLCHGIPLLLSPAAAEGVGVEHGVSAMIYSGFDDAIACLRQLIASPTLAADLATEGKKLFDSRFDRHVVLDGWQQLLQVTSRSRS